MTETELLTDTRNEAEIEAEEKERLAERKRKYKETQRYLQTKDFEELDEKFIKKGEELLEGIKEELKNRKETKCTKSEIDRITNFITFIEDVRDNLGESEGEKILKEEFVTVIENAYSNIYNKIEELFDAPIYTELDLLKQTRIDYSLAGKRIKGISAGFLDTKDKNGNPNPYEQA